MVPDKFLEKVSKQKRSGATMSRKCPKRYHLFLNWMRVNATRFPYESRVFCIRKDRILFGFNGITNAIRFEYYCRRSLESCSWISVDSIHPENKQEGIARFFGAEVKTKMGWITLRQPPDNRYYWRTREELWVELCFEAFLEWCNIKLAGSRWLAIYEFYGNCTEARLQIDCQSL